MQNAGQADLKALADCKESLKEKPYLITFGESARLSPLLDFNKDSVEI